MKSAEDILGIMKRVGIEPVAETYTILICGHIKHGNMGKVDSLLEHCNSANICLTNKDYYEMIYCTARFNQDVDKVLEVEYLTVLSLMNNNLGD